MDKTVSLSYPHGKIKVKCISADVAAILPEMQVCL